jgi:hypothetical protein
MATPEEQYKEVAEIFFEKLPKAKELSELEAMGLIAQAFPKTVRFAEEQMGEYMDDSDITGTEMAIVKQLKEKREKA